MILSVCSAGAMGGQGGAGDRIGSEVLQETTPLNGSGMSPMTHRPLQRAAEKLSKGEGAGEEQSLHRKVPSSRAKSSQRNKVTTLYHHPLQTLPAGTLTSHLPLPNWLHPIGGGQRHFHTVSLSHRGWSRMSHRPCTSSGCDPPDPCSQLPFHILPNLRGWQGRHPQQKCLV